ncbi:Unknown protein [Striga hermonthica]|uniref:At3g05675-like ankyrin-like domain-containing protein n=1 Tax=Striga hermonthica TaxID=68872 RepID=A0A9N7P5M2_STRHE|nr:Unknown protein [Striga hermonthica]
MPVLSTPEPANLTATKNAFISAVQFATSSNGPCPTLGYGPRVSAQEQVEYMLANDECSLSSNHDILSEARTALSRTLSSFERQLSESSEEGIARGLLDLEWMCGVSPRMGLMAEFVSGWIDSSERILKAVEARGLGQGFRAGIARVVYRVLDAVGYGSVILRAAGRVRLLKLWVPFVRRSRDEVLDGWLEGERDGDVWEGIEGAIVSIVSGLPSDDQAEILEEWMDGGDRARYPDLSEAFEVWCFRSKSAKRRLGFSIV